MGTPKKTSTRTPRSRTETKSELKEIQEERGGLEATDAKSAEATKTRNLFVRQAVHSMTVEGVIKAAADLKLAASTALDDVTAKLAAKVEELRLTEEALELSKSEFQDIHNMDVAATSIDILLEEHEEKMVEIAANIEAQLAAWAKDTRERADGLKAQNAALDVERARERDAYEYTKLQERRKKEDEFGQALLARQRAEQDRAAALEKTWLDREATLKKQEDDVFVLRNQVAGFDERLKKETSTAVAIATSSLKKDLLQDFALKEKDSATALIVEMAARSQLTDTVKKQEEAITQLQARIQELQRQVVDTASKAIDGASKQEAFNQYMQTQREVGGGASAPKNRS